MTPPAQPVITDAAERGRFEAHLDGELAGVLEYVVKYGRIALVHSEVRPSHEGRGVGSAVSRSTTLAGADCGSSRSVHTSRTT
jgi:uncharacterized protein